MYRATTPTHTFTLPFDTSVCKEIQLTYSQEGRNILVKHYQDEILPEGMTLDGADVNVFLTQDETKMFKKGRAQAQFRILTTANKVIASQKMQVPVHDVFNEEVLT